MYLRGCVRSCMQEWMKSGSKTLTKYKEKEELKIISINLIFALDGEIYW